MVPAHSFSGIPMKLVLILKAVKYGLQGKNSVVALEYGSQLLVHLLYDNKKNE